MLTLRDLKKMIQTPEKNEKIPTDKLLKERKIPVVVSKKIGNGEGMALVTVFQNGYAMYQTAGRATVFPVSSCRYEYESVMNGKTVRMEESFFDEKEWYLSLLMIGEDRIVSNSLSRDRNHKGQIRKVKKEKQNLLKKQKKKPCVRQKKTQKREKVNRLPHPGKKRQEAGNL